MAIDAPVDASMSGGGPFRGHPFRGLLGCVLAAAARAVRWPLSASALTLVVIAAAALTLPAAALALTPGRVYERVSPAFKGGYGVRSIVGVEPGGEAVSFEAFGVFAGVGSDAAGNAFQAARSASGWRTAALQPSAAVSPRTGLVAGFTPSLGESLWGLPLGLRNSQSTTNQVQLEMHAPGAPNMQAGFEPVGPLLKVIATEYLPVPDFFQTKVEGFSVDFCHVVFSTDYPANLIETDPPLPPEAFSNNSQMRYEVSAGCHGEPRYVRLLPLSSAGKALGNECAEIGAATTAQAFNAVSADGSEVFFRDANAVVAGGGCTDHDQLFVRLGGVKTLEVSKPMGECPGGEVPCGGEMTRPPSFFWGASEDGSRVFFTTSARLTPESDGGNDLYMAVIGCPGEASGCEASQRVVTKLVLVSHDPQAGQAAEVQGVAAVASDGGRVYFVARGVLSETPNSQGEAAQAGADNLYVYDTGTGQMAFVADLCSGPGKSGAATDAACPSDLTAGVFERNDADMWLSFPSAHEAPAQTAGEAGRFLVFTTYAQLITSGPEADTDDAQDVYRYDAQTGELRRVSVGEGGYGANGNANDAGAPSVQIDSFQAGASDARVQSEVLVESVKQEERGGVRRDVSEDGSRIVFMTAEPLSPMATNGQVNVYEWHDGAVSLISCGCSTEADEEAVITPSGRDVFFVTSAGLVSEDTDGVPDVYDARLGGGFPAPEPPLQRCEGDACQGPLTNPAPLLVPSSAVQAAGENDASPVAPKQKPAKKHKKRTRACRRRRACARHGRGGRTRR
jgi:hypothetical protein